MNVEQFAQELKLPPQLLLEQLRAAGVFKTDVVDTVTEGDKAHLLDYLRKMHGGGAEEGKTKITLTRKQTGEIRRIETRKKRMYVKRDNTAPALDTTIAEIRQPLKELKPRLEIVSPLKHERQSRVDGYFLKFQKLLPEHPNESLNIMRKTVEAICKDILDESCKGKDEGKVVKPASAFTSLEDMIQELKRRKLIPVRIEKYLLTLQMWGNFGSHDQESDSDDISNEISVCIMANSLEDPFKHLVDWYKSCK